MLTRMGWTVAWERDMLLINLDMTSDLDLKGPNKLLQGSIESSTSLPGASLRISILSEISQSTTTLQEYIQRQ